MVGENSHGVLHGGWFAGNSSAPARGCSWRSSTPHKMFDLLRHGAAHHPSVCNVHCLCVPLGRVHWSGYNATARAISPCHGPLPHQPGHTLHSLPLGCLLYCVSWSSHSEKSERGWTLGTATAVCSRTGVSCQHELHCGHLRAYALRLLPWHPHPDNAIGPTPRRCGAMGTKPFLQLQRLLRPAYHPISHKYIHGHAATRR
mmetsp:Transcript_26852/g.52561  ORF Transcript_26852/g.52561 Transcript_26852/m.52561 type:complete len:201 (+) Transcript_26852:706-1308(+)